LALGPLLGRTEAIGAKLKAERRPLTACIFAAT